MSSAAATAMLKPRNTILALVKSTNFNFFKNVQNRQLAIFQSSLFPIVEFFTFQADFSFHIVLTGLIHCQRVTCKVLCANLEFYLISRIFTNLAWNLCMRAVAHKLTETRCLRKRRTVVRSVGKVGPCHRGEFGPGQGETDLTVRSAE